MNWTKTLSLWRDDRGTASIVSLIFVTAILALGAIVGLAVLRNQVVQEFGDAAVALDQLDQSFSYTLRVDGNRDGLLGEQPVRRPHQPHRPGKNRRAVANSAARRARCSIHAMPPRGRIRIRC